MSGEHLRRASMTERGADWVGTVRRTALARFLHDGAREIGDDPADLADDSQDSVVAAFRLQNAPDYRAAIRAWFRAVRPGGHLVIVVPHAFLYERQLALPSPWETAQRRLYTPASLLEEVEEALTPNSYRVRHLGDQDEGYDYASSDGEPPAGPSDIVLAIEKIAAPARPLRVAADDARAATRPATPDYQFDPPRTRVEVSSPAAPRRIIVMKPDHLGDFIIALGALERIRALFPAAEITLVCGSWNADMARALGIADHIIPFDVFPRNSSEEEVDVPGKSALFRQAVTGSYDLAIDLRGDYDTRFFLRLIDARLRAGIGTRARFPFLDIFLPVDATRNENEAAREYLFTHKSFASQGPATRGEHRVVSRADTIERYCAIIWGPYQALRPGRYIFEPYVELAEGERGLLKYDIALDTHEVARQLVEHDGPVRLPFHVERAGSQFEFRIWAMEGVPSIGFSFFGGRLIQAGAESVLHQSEYQLLLVELIALRLARTGVLEDARAP